MNASGAGPVVAAWVTACGAIAIGVACIPDLPSGQDAGGPQPFGFCGDGIIDLAAGEQCDPGPGAGDAGIGGCSGACQMQCPSGAPPWPMNHHCYQLVGSPGAGSLRSAAGACPGASHVVTFAGEEEFQFVLPLVGGGLPFWVGISTSSASSSPYSEAPFEPSWTLGCPGCYAHTLTPDAGLPAFPDASVDGGILDCFAALSDPSQPWQEYPCRGLSHELLDVVCELEPVGRQSRSCEAGICVDLVKTHGAKAYVYHSSRATPDNASRACVALGGRLVVLQSRDEREQLWRELSRLTVPPDAVWIGLSQTSPASSQSPVGTWAWDDHTPAEGTGAYAPEWATGQPLRFGRGGTTRAFLYHDSHSPAIDDTLARNEPTLTISGTLPYVCEIAVATH